jgi:hypothetical protein
MLRDITAASESSAKNHVAFGFTPTSLSNVESITPVHSLWLFKPQISWGSLFPYLFGNFLSILKKQFSKQKGGCVINCMMRLHYVEDSQFNV